jgi:predicted DNA-binding transcriptional regulator YafY
VSASRLLQILLLLQNHGRMTARDLARLLEVAQRTILRDVDALTEAGLPMVEDDLAPDAPIGLDACGDINISSKTFARTSAARGA